MFDKRQIDLIKKELPKNYQSLVRKRLKDQGTELSVSTIARFFRNVELKTVNAELIYDAALEIWTERTVKAEERKRRTALLMQSQNNQEQLGLNL